MSIPFLSFLLTAGWTGFALADFVLVPSGFIANESSVDISPGCVSAMESTVTCDQWFQANAYDDYYGSLNDTVLDSLCTTDCKSSLASYRTTVVSSCNSDPQPFDGIPATYFVDVVQASYNFTCLKDSGSNQYCNNFITNLTSSISTDTSMTNLPKSQLCSPCLLALGRLIQSTSYSNYDDTVASEWSTIQKQCGVSYPTGVQPPAASPTNVPGFNTNYTASTDCLSGNTYNVVSGDNCVGISTSKGVSTGGLTVINQLLPDCSNLLGGQSLCLPQTCQIYEVQSGDDCYGIANKTNISYTQLLSWNPTIDGFCSNLISGQNICVDQPGAVWTGTTIPGASATKTDAYASATVSPPGPTPHGTTTRCGRYYGVSSGDDCHLITLNYTITVSLFEAINPDVNTDCTNLKPGLFYCVFPTADWNDTDTGSATTTTAYVTAPAPTPTGTTPQCYEYHTIVSGDYCGLLEDEYGITFAQLQLWNPDLDAACGNLKLGEAYCVDGSSSPQGGAPPHTGSALSPPAQTNPPGPPGPTQSGIASNCNKWTVVQAGGSCGAIETQYGITFQQFLGWNPAVGSNCQNLWVGEAYCVGVGGTTARKRALLQAKEHLRHGSGF